MSFARSWATPTTAIPRQREPLRFAQMLPGSSHRESRRQPVRITPENRKREMTAVRCPLPPMPTRSSIDAIRHWIQVTVCRPIEQAVQCPCGPVGCSRKAATGNSLGREPQAELPRTPERAAKRRQESVSVRGQLDMRPSHVAASRLSGTWDRFSWGLRPRLSHVAASRLSRLHLRRQNVEEARMRGACT